MLEIIPNWHPALVHFPIALIVVSALLTLAAKLAGNRPLAGPWWAVGHWTLWLGAFSAVAAALAGWFAFNSVDHDDAGHIAMLLHRNWAVATVAAIVALAIWDAVRTGLGKAVSWLFAALLVLAAASVVTTAWLGGELVYRHRLGVMTPPRIDPLPPPKEEAQLQPAEIVRQPKSHDHGAHKH